MNGKGTMLYSESPIEGEYYFKFKQWRAKPDEVPEPRYDAGGKQMVDRDNPARKWVTKPSLSMDAVCEIVEGKWVGLTAMAMLPYTFVPDDNGNAKHETGQKAIERLKAWDRATGLSELVFPYEKNLLPKMGAAILKADRVFQGTVVGGLIKSVSLPVDGYKPPRIKAAKKAPARRK
jgi:hypothetical protein